MSEQKIHLTDDQQAVVNFPPDQPLKVMAGAGTGKTTVLWHRYNALINQHGYRPQKILTLTFTRKSAASLRDRIFSGLQTRQEMVESEIYNYDAFWWKLLQENMLAAGLDSGVSIIPEMEQRQLQDSVIDALLSEPGLLDREQFPDIDDINLGKLLSAMLAMRSEAQNYLMTGRTLVEYIAAQLERKAEGESSDHVDLDKQYLYLWRQIVPQYEQALAAQHYIEFGDVLCRVFTLLRDNPQIRENYRKRYRYLLIDEAQDTSFAQFAVVKMLSADDGSNITIVGDDKQSIYKWRGAYLRNIREFAAEAKPLRDNFRSWNQILDLANWTICLDEYFEEQADQIHLRNPIAGDSAETVVKFHLAETRDDEAAYLAAAVAREHARGVPWHDIAVIMRTTTHLTRYEQALERAGIPCVVGGARLYESQEFLDVLAILRFYTAPDEPHAFFRLLEQSPTGLNMAEMQVIADLRNSTRPPLTPLELLKTLDGISGLTTDGLQRALQFTAQWERLLAAGISGSLVQIIRRILRDTGYAEMASGDVSTTGDHRRYAMREVLHEARRIETEQPTITLSGFVGYLHQLFEASAEAGSAEPQTSKNAVPLLTIHRSKGLEYPVVFYVDVVEKTQRHSNPFYLDIEPVEKELDVHWQGQGPIPRKYQLKGREIENPDWEDIKSEAGYRAEHDNEELRLRYVAVTRAQDRLFLTSSRQGLRNKSKGYFMQAMERFQECDGFKYETVLSFAPVAVDTGQEVDPEHRTHTMQSIQNAVARVRRGINIETCTDAASTLTLSFPRYEMYRTCPRQYYYRYVLGMAIPVTEAEHNSQEPAPDSSFNGPLFGTLVHRTLDRGAANVDILMQQLQEEMRRADITDRQWTTRYQPRAEKVFQNFFNMQLHEAECLYSEQDFHVHLTLKCGITLHVHGVVDRIQRIGGKMQLVDFKTNRSIPDALQDQYCRQLQFYHYAVEQGCFSGVDRVELQLVSLSEGRTLLVEPDENLGEQLERDAEKIAVNNFTFNDSAHSARPCETCACVSFCPDSRAEIEDVHV
jgi:DNA helicase II / ATP-dependent DNA helicase PcrA